MKRKLNQKIDVPEICSPFISRKEYIVKFNPHNIAMIGALLLTLMVLFLFLLFQFLGGTISLKVVLIYPALIFVIGYGIIGILTYYGISVLQESKKSDESPEANSENITQQTQ